MDRFLLIAFLCVNWSHFAFSQGRLCDVIYNIGLKIVQQEVKTGLLLPPEKRSDSAIGQICDLQSLTK